MKIFNKKIRRRQLKKFGWILISMLAVISMVAFTVAPGMSAF
jgi:uncharacterized membrane protein